MSQLTSAWNLVSAVWHTGRDDCSIVMIVQSLGLAQDIQLPLSSMQTGTFSVYRVVETESGVPLQGWLCLPPV